MTAEVWKEFEENELTHSAAHHLVAILELREKQGYARVTDVAKDLSITTGSASTNLKNLKERGFVAEDDNKFLLLTPLGESLARQVIEHRKVFLTFLVDTLGVSAAQAEIDACKTEHLLSPETTSKLARFLAGKRKEAHT